MKPYFLVMMTDGSESRHSSPLDAMRRAEEVAKLAPEENVLILQVIGITSMQPQTASTFWLDRSDSLEEADQNTAIKELVRISTKQSLKILELQKEIDRIKTL